MTTTIAGERPLSPGRDGFTPDELKLNYTEWTALVEQRRKHLSPGARLWLSDWSIWDLACSPMSDEERPMVRYGHYLGWWDRWHRERPNPAQPHDTPTSQEAA